MLPYVNPNYFQQPIYQNPMAYPQNYSQVQNSTLNGRMIDDINGISANDVPMQGISVFPKNDMSEVYIKSWQPNGTIRTIRYLPYNPVVTAEVDKVSSDTQEVAKQAPYEVTEGIMNALASIESKLDKIMKPNKVKKEVEE